MCIRDVVTRVICPNKRRMESQYIKQTVGASLTAALTSLILNVPYNGEISPESTTIDPISYIGQYLLETARREKEVDAFKTKMTINYPRLERNSKKRSRSKTST